MIESALKTSLQERLNTDIVTIELFKEGHIGSVYKVITADRHYVLKTSQPSTELQTEANMLKDINKYKISVPKVYDVTDTYILMEYVEEVSISIEAQELHAVKVLTDLHSVSNDSRMYGYYYNTNMASFEQNNEQTQYNWGLFLGQMRIMPMAKICYDRGHIDKSMVERLESLCRDLYKRIDMSEITPSLLHGDLRNSNILFNMNGATVIDPAIYFGDREVDLASILLSHTFGESFFEKYNEMHPLSDDFYEVKVALYQIYPMLAAVALFGSSYRGALENNLQRLKI